MPKVRASSATMGTMRGPSAGSFSRLASMRTKAIVVDISLPSACKANSPQVAISGTGTTGLSAMRSGSGPPRAVRRARR